MDIFYKRGADTPTRKWRRADILAVNGDEIVIHYINWDSKFDETLNIRKNADRIAPPGSMTNLASMNGHTTRINGTFSNHTTPRFKNRDLPQQASELDNINSSSNGVMRRDGSRKNGISQKNNYHDGKNGYYISAADQQLAEEEAEIDRQFIQILEDRGLHVIEIVGDGNCLFRAISHQLYLNEHKHLELREKCVNHMLEHKKRFEVFCYDENFDDHIKSMKLPGTWADDLEIRALEEILDRLICIYSPESIGNNGEEPIKKNFEEDILLKSVETINLSYHGNNHYNSIYDERYKLPLSLRDTNIILSSRLKLFEQNINSSLQKNERVQSGRNNDEFDKKE